MVGSWVAPQLAGRLQDVRPLSVALTASSIVGLVVLVLGGPVLVAVVLLGVGQGSIFPLALTLFVIRAPEAQTAGAVSMVAQCLGFVGAASALTGLTLLHTSWGSWPGLWAVVLVVAAVQGVVGRAAASPHEVPALRTLSRVDR